MSIKKIKFLDWIHTCPLKDWVELYDDNEYTVIQFNKATNENNCPDKLEPGHLPQTSIEKLQKKYGKNTKN